MADPAKNFEDLIAPLPVCEFFARYWEKDFLHLHNAPGRFASYFSLHDFDSWLTSARGTLFVSPQEADAPTESYSPSAISLSTAYAAFARGSLLVLSPMTDWPPLQGLVKALGRDFHAEIKVEAHLAPKNTRTFPPYAAGHDVLILQLEGERVWHLHELSLLQVNPVQKKNLKFPLDWYGRTKAPVVAEVCLKPGDLLFVPRGMPHRAAPENGVSLHLDFAITPFVWMDFLRVATECVAVRSAELRRALPPGFVEDQETGESLRSTFQRVMKTFQEMASFDEVLAAVRRNRVTLQSYPPDGHFAQLSVLPGLTLEAEVERRRNVLCTVDDVTDVDRNPKVAIFFGNEHVAGPPHLRRALEFIRDQGKFRVSEIPGLNAKGQLVLAKRLILEGLLRQTVGAEPGSAPDPPTPTSD